MSLSYAYNTVYFYIFVLYISTLEPVLCIDGVIFLFCGSFPSSLFLLSPDRTGSLLKDYNSEFWIEIACNSTECFMFTLHVFVSLQRIRLKINDKKIGQQI